MRRALVISEAHGLYKISHDGWEATGASLESALVKAWRQAVQGPPGIPAIDAPSEPEVRNQFEMAEVLETLMGPKSTGGGQFHEGILSG